MENIYSSFDNKSDITPLSQKFMFVKEGSSSIKIKFEDIRYVEGLKDYIKIYLDKEYIITKCTIKHIEQKSPKDIFVRIHKSYIISIDKINKIEFNHAFIEQKKIPVGQQFKDAFYNRINSYRL